MSVLCSQLCAGALDNPYRNLSEFWEVLFIGKEEKIQEHIRNMDIQPYSCEADETFEGEYEFIWQGHKIFLKETPGHSKGSICILVDEKILFSGDTLVTGHETILRLPGGSEKKFAGIHYRYLSHLTRNYVYPDMRTAEISRVYEIVKGEKVQCPTNLIFLILLSVLVQRAKIPAAVAGILR